MARRYNRDARGRFAAKGYSGQSGGRGARLTSKGQRVGGGAKIKASSPVGTVGKPRGLKPNSIKPKSTSATSTKRQRLTAPRPQATIAKPKDLRPGAISDRIVDKSRAIIRQTESRIQRATARRKALTTAQREIDMRRANPVGGRAARAQATKRLNKAQRKLQKSRDTVFSAIEVNYKPRQEKALARIAAVERLRRRTAGMRVNRKGASYQRSIFGGSTAAYRK